MDNRWVREAARTTCGIVGHQYYTDGGKQKANPLVFRTAFVALLAPLLNDYSPTDQQRAFNPYPKPELVWKGKEFSCSGGGPATFLAGQPEER